MGIQTASHAAARPGPRGLRRLRLARILLSSRWMRAVVIGIILLSGCAFQSDAGEPAGLDGGGSDDSGSGPGALTAPLEDTDGPCTGARSSSIGGDVAGHPDGSSINAAIGVNLFDAAGHDVDGGGAPCTVAANNCNGASNYAYFIHLNPLVDEHGIAASTPGTTRRWSRCVSPKVVAMYLEGYPRSVAGPTSSTKYGETMSNRVEITARDVRYAMRFPIRYEYDAALGNTGNVNGFAHCHGAATPLTRLNAWTREPSTTCGIRAYQSGGHIDQTSGYWWLGPLAAGQCGAASQAVAVVGWATCDGVAMHESIDIEVVRGRTLGAVNFEFP